MISSKHPIHRRVSGSAIAIAISAMLCGNTSAQAQGDIHSERADQAMVVSDSAFASRIGRDVIAKGGNAVDAAVATAFAMAVTWPEAGNIGGGGFMVIRPADGKAPVCIDYRETAPLVSKVNTFSRGESRHTPKAAGVPGTVRGLELAHKTYGRLPWKEVVMPAVRLAERGFSVDAFLARSANSVLEATKDDPKFAELHRVYGKADGSPWKTGDIMTLPDLGKTLNAISDDPDTFYEGAVGELLVRETTQNGGLIRRQDLQNYRAKQREPIIGTFGEYTIIGAPPPSSGGIAIVLALNMAEAIDLPREKYDPKTMHLLAEISRRSFLDRARYLADPDFVEIPKHLTTKAYARKLVAEIDPNKATDSAELATDIRLADESEDTTHFSVVDADGMAVSNTYTLEASWGSRIVVRGAGFLLNNEMGDFNWVKGETDRKGNIGTDANLIEPGKRMLSSQCPVIVTKGDELYLVTGSPGGRTIINTVLNVVLNVIHFDMPAPLAVQSKRYHHQWMPDVLSLEDVAEPPFRDVKAALESRGHKTVNRVSQGSAHSIWRDPETKRLVGVADYRRGGRPAGIDANRTARWDFGGRKGVALDAEVSQGTNQLRWTNGIAGSELDGGDRFVIRRDAPEQPDRAYLKLPQIDSQVEATIQLDGISFAGPSKNERLQLAFTQTDSQKPLIVASMNLARNDANQIVLSGEALGEGASSVSEVVLSKQPDLEEAIAIRLRANLEDDIYEIGLKRPTELKFKTIGQGRIDASREIGFARLRAVNDFGAPGEYLRIDSLELVSGWSNE